MAVSGKLLRSFLLQKKAVWSIEELETGGKNRDLSYMRSLQDRLVRKLVSKARSISGRARRRFMKAGHAGKGGHIGWLDYEETIYRTFEYQYWENESNVIPFGNYYEFGLLNGASFLRCYRALTALAKDLGYPGVNEFGVRLYGFDSFEGLPEPGESDRRTGWERGAMACGRDKFEEIMDRQRVPREAYHLIEGFYQNSLTAELRDSLKDNKPSLVMMDCDFYSSTKTVLEWIRPLLRDGTFFMFDDIWAFMGHPDFGELRAIREFNASGPGLLVPHYFGGASQQVYVFTTGYEGVTYKDYLRSRRLASDTNN
jgi:O-methyltransferase